MMELQVIDKREILGQEITTFGDLENPIFLAKDVANWIEHNKPNEMIANVDEDEKLKAKISHAGQNREMWFLTEDGLYEVLMQSRKPIAKQFKREVKKILKNLRLNKFNPYKNLSTEMKAIIMHDEKIQEVQKEVSEVKEDLNYFKDDIPLFTVECEEISKAVKRIGTKALGGKGSKSYSNKSLRAKVYSDIHRQLKREFDVNSYKAIKRRYLSDALDIVAGYNLTIALKEQISMLNDQVAFA